MKNHTLIFLVDVKDENGDLSLGPKSILRLETGIVHARSSGDTIVCCTPFSPMYPHQSESLAVLAAKWLKEQGFENVIVDRAKRFDTDSELDVFFSNRYDGGSRTIVSAPYHLRRVKVIVKRKFGRAKSDATEYLPVEADNPSFKEMILEPLKWVALYTPVTWQQHAFRLLQKLGINPSW